MSESFAQRQLVHRPRCPFCALPLDKPRETMDQKSLEMPVGTCACGAVYVCDVTGHNLGAALVQALVFASGGDWDQALELESGEDYEEEVLTRYDYESHLVVPGGYLESRRIAGALYCLRLKKEIREVAAAPAREAVESASPARSAAVSPRRAGTFSKQDVEQAVTAYAVRDIAEMAGRDKRVLRGIQRLLYSGDAQVRYRAADMIGRAAAVVGQQDSAAVSNLLQRLLTSVVDTAASGWGALEAVGEIVRNRPDLFAGYIPHLLDMLRDEHLRPAALWCIGRIAEARPDIIRPFAHRFPRLLEDKSAPVRAYAAWLMGLLNVSEAAPQLDLLRDDDAGALFYDSGYVEERSVGQAASEALDRIG